MAPKKKKIVFIGTFIGIFIGSTFAFLIEKKSNNIFTTNELKKFGIILSLEYYFMKLFKNWKSQLNS